MNWKLHENWCKKILSYIEIFSRALNISSETINYAIQVVFKIREYSVLFSGKSYKAIAAAIIYISANQFNILLTQKDICLVAGVSIVTLQERMKNIRKILY